MGTNVGQIDGIEMAYNIRERPERDTCACKANLLASFQITEVNINTM